MEEKYKVIKDLSALKEGDILYKDNQGVHYHFIEKDKNGYEHKIHLNKNIVEGLMRTSCIEKII